MKKYLLGIIVCICFSQTTSAQSRFSLGPNAGFGGAWIDNFKDNKYKPAGNFGVSLIYSTESSFGIGADLKYSFEGGERHFQTTIPGTTLTTVEDIALDYIRIPVKAMWFFGNYGNRVRPKVSVGPSFGFLVGGKTDITTTTSTGAAVYQKKLDSEDDWDKFDIGVTASAGLNYRLVKNIWFNADLAYLHGLRDAREDDKKNPATYPGYAQNQSYKNRNLQINIGVNFGL